MSEQTFAEKVVEAIGVEYWGPISEDEIELVEMSKESFDRLLAVLSKAIEQRREYSPSTAIDDCLDAELLSVANGESK